MKRNLVSALALLSFASAICYAQDAKQPKYEYYESADDLDCQAFKKALADRRFDANPERDAREKHDWLYSPDLYWSFLWENDSFAAGGDRHYTNGMKLSWLRNPCRDKWPWHKWAERALRKVHGESGQTQNQSGVNYYTGGVFGMNMYTPTNIVTRERQTFDRPFVGWLYFGPQVQRASLPEKDPKPSRSSIEEGATASTAELQLGVIGPRAGQGSVQEWIHRDWHASSNIPRGWDNQVGDRLGVNLFYTWTRNYWLPNCWRPDFLSFMDFRGSVFGGGAAGNLLRYATAGAVLAIGKPGEDLFDSPTNKPFVHLPDGGDGDTQKEKRVIMKKSFTVFLGTEHRYIAHSIFVQGSGAAAHDISLVRHVFDVFGGFSAPLWKDVSFTAKVIRRSVEFHSSEPSVVQPHRFGQAGVDYRF